MSEEVGGILSESFVITWRMFIMLAVVLFVVFTVGATFASKQDIRQAEAMLLSSKILECISNKGVISSNFNLDNCFNGDYYVNATLSSLESNFNKSLIKGSSIVEVNCRLIEQGKEMEKYPSCLHQFYYTLINNNGKIEKGRLELLVGVEKYSENIKL